jgi:heterodisulfide reductase subunit A
MAFIHCVGARQIEGVNQRQPDGKVKDYCARTCCTGTLHAALEIRRRHPEVMITDFYQDIRTYGRGHEAYYEQASEAGILFVRYDPRHPPKVEGNPKGDSPLLVRTSDLLTGGLDVEMPADLVVLATGVVPHDISELVGMYHCAVGSDSFLLEVHPKLRPVELAVAGVFLAGSCQGPMDVTEACAAASAAASKSAALIAQAQVEMDPFIAKVDEELCTGCETCLTVCPYDAITRDETRGIAVVSEARCTGCGTCAATCPSNAIQQFGFNDAQVLAEVKALLQGAALG